MGCRWEGRTPSLTSRGACSFWQWHVKQYFLTRGATLRTLLEGALRTDTLAHQYFRLAGDHVISQLADPLVTQARIKSLRAPVEARDTEEDIRAVAKDPILGKVKQLR